MGSRYHACALHTRSPFAILILSTVFLSCATVALAAEHIEEREGGGGSDNAPPSGTITLNGGAASTRSASVTLTLAATDDSGTVSQMQFSNDGLTYMTPEPYVTTKPWTLPAGDGSKTVFVKFCDPSDHWSPPTSATIRLDTIPPQIVMTSPQDGQVFGLTDPAPPKPPPIDIEEPR